MRITCEFPLAASTVPTRGVQAKPRGRRLWSQEQPPGADGRHGSGGRAQVARNGVGQRDRGRSIRPMGILEGPNLDRSFEMAPIYHCHGLFSRKHAKHGGVMFCVVQLYLHPQKVRR